MLDGPFLRVLFAAALGAGAACDGAPAPSRIAGEVARYVETGYTLPFEGRDVPYYLPGAGTSARAGVAWAF